MDEKIDLLEQLNRLRDSGALTDEEFQTEKTRILRSDYQVGADTSGPAAEARSRMLEKIDGAKVGGAALTALLAGASLYWFLSTADAAPSQIENSLIQTQEAAQGGEAPPRSGLVTARVSNA